MAASKRVFLAHIDRSELAVNSDQGRAASQNVSQDLLEKGIAFYGQSEADSFIGEMLAVSTGLPEDDKFLVNLYHTFIKVNINVSNEYWLVLVPQISNLEPAITKTKIAHQLGKKIRLIYYDTPPQQIDSYKATIEAEIKDDSLIIEMYKYDSSEYHKLIKGLRPPHPLLLHVDNKIVEGLILFGGVVLIIVLAMLVLSIAFPQGGILLFGPVVASLFILAFGIFKIPGVDRIFDLFKFGQGKHSAKPSVNSKEPALPSNKHYLPETDYSARSPEDEGGQGEMAKEILDEEKGILNGS